MFGIFPKDEPIDIEGELVLPASIIIDTFSEMVNIPLSYWNIEDYKRSWLSSLKEGLVSKNHAALVVSMNDPALANFIFTWVIYFEDEIAYVQNSIIFLSDSDNFVPDRINEFIDKRTTHDEDGMKISEWRTDLNSIQSFFDSLK